MKIPSTDRFLDSEQATEVNWLYVASDRDWSVWTGVAYWVAFVVSKICFPSLFCYVDQRSRIRRVNDTLLQNFANRLVLRLQSQLWSFVGCSQIAQTAVIRGFYVHLQRKWRMLSHLSACGRRRHCASLPWDLLSRDTPVIPWLHYLLDSVRWSIRLFSAGCNSRREYRKKLQIVGNMSCEPFVPRATGIPNFSPKGQKKLWHSGL